MTSLFQNLLTLLTILVLAGGPLILLVFVLRIGVDALESNKINQKHKLFIDVLGENIKYYRDQHQMSKSFVANKLDVSQRLISKWEDGQIDPPIGKLISLSELFEIELHELIGYE